MRLNNLSFSLYSDNTLLTEVRTVPIVGQFFIDSNGYIDIGGDQLGQDITVIVQDEILVANQNKSTDKSFYCNTKSVLHNSEAHTELRTYTQSKEGLFVSRFVDGKFISDQTYMFDLKTNGIISYLPLFIYDNTSSLASSLLVKEYPMGSLKQLTSSGDYMLDTINGKLYVRIDVIKYSLSILSLSIFFTSREDMPVTDYVYDHDLQRITINAPKYYEMTQTIPSDTQDITLSVPQGFRLVRGSISIPNHIEVDTFAVSTDVKAIELRRTSRDGNVSKFTLPFWPVDRSLPFTFVTTGMGVEGGTADKDWFISNEYVLNVHDSADTVSKLVVTYSFVLNNNTNYLNNYIVDYENSKLTFRTKTTKELPMKGNVSGYRLKYMPFAPNTKAKMSFDISSIRISELDPNYKHIVGYRTSSTIGEPNTNMQRYIKLLPEWVEIEVNV
jgi:hypothetical protein